MSIINLILCTTSIACLSLASLSVSSTSFDEEMIETYSNSENPFSFIVRSSKAYKLLDCADGYVYYYVDIYKANYTENSNLFLIHSEVTYTPGYVARINNEVQTNGSKYNNYMLKRGYLHMNIR